MSDSEFLSVKGRVLACIADDPRVRLRDIAHCLGITERSAYVNVKYLTDAGYVVKTREGSRNHYQVDDRPLVRHLQQVSKIATSDGGPQ